MGESGEVRPGAARGGSGRANSFNTRCHAG